MSQALQATSAASWLLANREQLSLSKATTYLVGRLRTRTPLGACEFLKGLGSSFWQDEAIASTLREGRLTERDYARQCFDARVELATTCVNLYETIFPREYKASPSPAFSVQQEHEFYRLINERLFPLPSIEKEIKRDPGFFYPYIPVRGQQDHDWTRGCCPFESLQIMFKLALVLSGRKEWRKLGLAKQPAPPLDAPAWTFFLYSLAVEPSPLRYFKHAIDLTCYSTGNVWLDMPRTAAGEGFTAGYAWSAEVIARLCLARLQADEINARVAALEGWFQDDPGPRVARAVELWNAASEATAREDGRRVYV